MKGPPFAKKFNVHPKQILRGGVGFIGILVLASLLFFAKNLIFLFLSVVYPAFRTAKILNNDDMFSKDGRLWLSYWTCYGFISILNIFFGFLVRHIPLFNFFECVFTLWLYNNKTRGAEFINHNIFMPFIKQYGGFVDKKVVQAKEALGRVSPSTVKSTVKEQ
jgi:receptor expression-enhancing protein 5/6